MSAGTTPSRRRLRIVVWGPGQVGRAVLRTALDDDRFEVVGVKARSDKRAGSDIATLVKRDPVGAFVTTSVDDVVALEPDCVVLTPAARALYKGLDHDVIRLLEAGINVVASAAYHNVTMPNFLSAQRVPPERLLEACLSGGATLFGTGVHPSFMVERLVMTMAQLLNEVTHVRLVEAADFSGMPGGMWGGFDAFGFGKDPDAIHADMPIAMGGDLYYGDVLGNVAHALYGAHNDEVRVERSFRGLPAAEDVEVGGMTIAAGTVGAVHLVHRGYLGDRCFMTNEECWYLAPAVTFRGDDLPFGGFGQPASYTIELTGTPANLRSQIEFEHVGGIDPITNGSVRAILDAIAPVVAAEPGILIDDPAPHYRPDDRIG